MDYEALAKQYGGAAALPPVDYDALAKQYGGVTAAPKSLVDQIPGMPPVTAPTPTPSLYQRVLGAAEVVPGLIGGAVSSVAAPVAGLVSSLTSGKFGTPEGAAAGERTVKRTQEMLGYRPVTQPGAENIQAVGEAMAPLVGVPVPTMNALARTSGAPIRLATNALRGEAELAGGAVSNLATAPAARKAAAQKVDIARHAVRNQTLEEGQALGLKVTPGSVTPSIQNVTLERLGGKSRLESQIQEQNTLVFDNTARRALDLPENTTRLEPETTQAVRAEEFQKGYAPLMQAGQIASDNTFASTMQNIAEKYTGPSRSFPGAVPETVSKAIDTYSVPTFDAADALTASAKLREEAASNFRKGENGVAKAQREIATALEDQIERHLTATGTPNATAMLAQFRASRTRMAISHAVEDSIIEGSGSVDPRKWAANIQSGKLLTGDMEVAAKFANTFKTSVKTPGTGGTPGAQQGMGLGSGLRGTAGAIVGGLLSGGNLIGAGIGAAAPEMASAAARKYLMSPLGQRRALPAYARNVRPDVPDTGLTLAPSWEQSAFAPREAPPTQTGNQFTLGNYPSPQAPAQLTMPSIDYPGYPKQPVDIVRRYQEGAEAAQKATEAATRAPTGRGIALEMGPSGKLRPVSQGMVGATPDTILSAGYPLNSAVAKITSGRNFALSAEEKVAWDKTRVDIAEVAPGFNKLSDKAVLGKMQDRAWVEDAIQKARDKAAAFDEIANRAKSAQEIRDAVANRDRMLGLAESMDEALQAPRPVTLKGRQPGKKTAEAIRVNNLTFSGGVAPGALRLNQLAPERP